MSTMNFTYAGTLGGAGVLPETQTFQVASGTTSSIAIGDAVVCASGYCAKVANTGMNTTGKYGLARSVSTETSTAAGAVDVMFSPSGLKVNALLSTTGTQVNVLGPFRVAVSGSTQKIDLGNAGAATLYSFDNTTSTPSGVVTFPWAV